MQGFELINRRDFQTRHRDHFEISGLLVDCEVDLREQGAEEGTDKLHFGLKGARGYMGGASLVGTSVVWEHLGWDADECTYVVFVFVVQERDVHARGEGGHRLDVMVWRE